MPTVWSLECLRGFGWISNCQEGCSESNGAMGKILTVYRNSYYALIDLNYSFMIGSFRSKEDNIWRSAGVAFFFYGLFGATLGTAAYRVVISHYNLKEEDAIFTTLFVLPFVLNYFLLYNTEKHNYCVNVKGSIPGYAYFLTLFLLSGWFVFMLSAWYFDLPI
jgi:hypothetical protein